MKRLKLIQTAMLQDFVNYRRYLKISPGSKKLFDESSGFTSRERLKRYVGPYRQQLCGWLSFRFSAVCSVLGPAQSRRIIDTYLKDTKIKIGIPSRIGADFWRFLKLSPRVPYAAMLADLAKLEYCIGQIQDSNNVNEAKRFRTYWPVIELFSETNKQGVLKGAKRRQRTVCVFSRKNEVKLAYVNYKRSGV